MGRNSIQNYLSHFFGAYVQHIILWMDYFFRILNSLSNCLLCVTSKGLLTPLNKRTKWFDEKMTLKEENITSVFPDTFSRLICLQNTAVSLVFCQNFFLKLNLSSNTCSWVQILMPFISQNNVWKSRILNVNKTTIKND